MKIRFDDKGKFFTDVVPKAAVSVMIQTIHQRIEGRIYLRPGERLKDEINNSEQFLAVTDAVIYSANNEELYHINFLTLNREHIVWIMPTDEFINEQNTTGGED